MRVAEAIRAATERLRKTSDTARLDAELLMAHALKTTRSELLIRRMDESAPQAFAGLVERRAAHEPVAYLTGATEFFGLSLSVTPDVLIPRGDSEALIEAAQEVFQDRAPPQTILDLGTGSGALLMAALSVWPMADGLGLDQSAKALAVAANNAQTLGMDRSRFVQRDWRQAGWRDDLGRFDLVVCNPPYVEQDAVLEPDVCDFEPAAALFAGEDGLDDYKRLIQELDSLLEPQGAALFEIGATQADAVSELAEKAGFIVARRTDLANRPRALILCKGKHQ